jgi:hypothetical protein
VSGLLEKCPNGRTVWPWSVKEQLAEDIHRPQLGDDVAALGGQENEFLWS